MDPNLDEATSVLALDADFLKTLDLVHRVHTRKSLTLFSAKWDQSPFTTWVEYKLRTQPSYLKQVTFNRSLKPGACDFHVPVLRPFHRRSNFGALRHELRISSKCHKPASQTYRPENDILTF